MRRKPGVLVLVLWVLAVSLYIFPAFAGEDQSVPAAAEEGSEEEREGSGNKEDPAEAASEPETGSEDADNTQKEKETETDEETGTDTGKVIEEETRSEADRDDENGKETEEEDGKTDRDDDGEKAESQIPETGQKILRTGVTAGLSWKEMENGDIVMEDGTVYTPVYPDSNTVQKRQAAAEKEVLPAQASLRKAAPRLLAAGRPSEVPESFSGTTVVNWRDNGSESSVFGLSDFPGLPAEAANEIGMIYTHCDDPTAAAPYEGMHCDYAATLTDWDSTTGTATYSLYVTPPGATDGVSRNEYGLIGYQHLAGELGAVA